MPDKIITAALKRFKLAEDAEKDIRAAALADIKFAKASEQWPDNIKANRNIAGQERPCLVINRLPQFIRQVTNDERMNRPQIRIDPVDDATVEDAKIREGLIRHIQVASNADIAYDTACDNQVTGGFGYIRIITEYCDETSFDQDIRIKRVKNPFTVYFDPYAIEPDYSDAKWAFVVEDIPREQFERDYNGKADYSSQSFVSIGDTGPSWGNNETIRIAEYFEVAEKTKTLYLLSDGSITYTKPEKEMLLTVENQRMVTERSLIWRKITGLEVLDEKPWAGKYIPIVPVLGEDVDIDGKRILKGMVRDATDPQRMYNYWASAQTEAIALAPKAPFIGAEGQFEGYEKEWDTANTRGFSRLTYKPTALNGSMVPPPQRNQAEPPVQAMVQALAQAGEDLKNTTGIYDASLGSRSNETSGKAIQARQHEGDISNFHYVDNLSRAIRAVGVILLDLIPKIYDAPRAIRILHEDNEAEIIKINQLFEHKGKQVTYDMGSGKYDVIVNTGPSYATKRQENAAAMIQMTQANPQLWQIIGDLMVKEMDWPGARDMADRLKKMLPPQLQDQQGQPPIPPELQAKMQESQQMIEQLTQALNVAHDKIENKQQEIESKERIATQNNETKVIIEAFKTESGNNMILLQTELKHLSDRLGMLHNNMPVESESENEETSIPANSAVDNNATPDNMSPA